MSVNIGASKLQLNVRIAYAGILGGGLPQIPPGWAFLTDDDGVFLTDDAGNYLIGEVV